jgi:hypothetical protein
MEKRGATARLRQRWERGTIARLRQRTRELERWCFVALLRDQIGRDEGEIEHVERTSTLIELMNGRAQSLNTI